MAKPIDLGHVDFKTQTAALGHFKDMLNRYALGEEISPKDHDDLLALIQRHPEAKQKIGCGVQRFVINMSDKGTRCFWIERTDGSRTDFSYIWAVKGEGPTLFQEFSEACREAVKTDLVIGKRNFFEINGDSDGRVKCAVTGELISFDEAHVDLDVGLEHELLAHSLGQRVRILRSYGRIFEGWIDLWNSVARR